MIVIAYHPEKERFWAMVNKSDNPKGCWLWQGSTRNKGYGAFVYKKDGKSINGRSHRYSYEIHRGEIPDKLFVLHDCDTPACVNPDHLFLGTNQDNVTDMMKKGRHVPGGTYAKEKAKYKKGTDHHACFLDEETVKSIRSDYIPGIFGYVKLSKKYKLKLTHIMQIIRRKIWKDMEKYLNNEDIIYGY